MAGEGSAYLLGCEGVSWGRVRGGGKEPLGESVQDLLPWPEFGPRPTVRVEGQGGDKLGQGVGAQTGKALAALVLGFNFGSR